MQITLIQSEIETAIKDYVHSIMHIKEGMEIDIELRAGRGENGYTANIDIVKQGAKPVAKPMLLSSRRAEEPTKKNEEEVPSSNQEEVVEQLPVRPQFRLTPATDVSSSTEQEPPFDPDTDTDESATSTNPTVEEVKPRNSIFANLNV